MRRMRLTHVVSVVPAVPVNPEDRPDRHHRQRLLPMIGDEGQRALADSTVLIAGCGALGTVAADLLCRAGVGTLVLVDRDVVEPTNLQRQTLFTERDAERRHLLRGEEVDEVAAHALDMGGGGGGIGMPRRSPTLA